jgi:hypothetical protein
MKHAIENTLGIALFLGIAVLSLSGCYEGRYYNHYHHHTHGWYDRHNTPPPAGVRWDVDVDLH